MRILKFIAVSTLLVGLTVSCAHHRKCDGKKDCKTSKNCDIKKKKCKDKKNCDVKKKNCKDKKNCDIKKKECKAGPKCSDKNCSFPHKR
ncbi:MAG: hypothetical protein HON90_06030 [Halobacteriovoraceae bacterium]|jgi:hypothetical protein|nr:hypothetical protein [Halobacteriovoraceae bacterium]